MQRHPLVYVLLSGIVIAVMFFVARAMTTPPQLSDIDFPSGRFNYTGTSTWSSLRCQGDAVGIDTQFDLYANNSFNPTYILPNQINPSNPNLQKKRVNSLTAIELLVNEEDIAFAVSSLPLTEALMSEQVERAREKGFILEEQAVAQDVTAIAAHPSLDLRKVGGLKLDDLRKIYTSNKQLNWQDFRGLEVPNVDITPFINRAEVEAANQGKPMPFKNMFCRINSLVRQSNPLTTARTGREKVSKTPGGIYLAPSALIYNYSHQQKFRVQPMPIVDAGGKLVLPFASSFNPQEICEKADSQDFLPVSVDSAYPQALQHETVYVVVKHYGANANKRQKEHEKAGRAYAKALKTKEGRNWLARMGFRPL